MCIFAGSVHDVSSTAIFARGIGNTRQVLVYSMALTASTDVAMVLPLPVPCIKDEATGKCEYKPAQLVIDFALFEDGRVGDVTVTKSSGMDVYDDRAVKAVKAASPFPRVPPELMARAKPGSAGVTIRAVVTYKLVTQP